MTEIEEKVIIARLPEGDGLYGWSVTVIRAVGPHKGQEHGVALLCGGAHGRHLAALIGRATARTMMIDTVEVDEAETELIEMLGKD